MVFLICLKQGISFNYRKILMKALNFVLVFVFAFVLSAPVFSQSFEKREASETSAKFSRSGDKGYLDDGATVVQVKRVSFPPPDFPRRALRLGVEGTVRLEFDIAPDGSVLDPYVVESNPPGVFDRNAIEAVRKALYEAPTYNGTSVKVNNVQIDLTFKLD